MSNLKPCPFCGDPAVLDTYYDFYRVRCDYPECPGNVKNGNGIWYGTVEHAVQRWNARVERTCEIEMRESGWGSVTRHCGECGADLDCDTRNNPQRYCPSCGAKVVDE